MSTRIDSEVDVQILKKIKLILTTSPFLLNHNPTTLPAPQPHPNNHPHHHQSTAHHPCNQGHIEHGVAVRPGKALFAHAVGGVGGTGRRHEGGVSRD